MLHFGDVDIEDYLVGEPIKQSKPWLVLRAHRFEDFHKKGEVSLDIEKHSLKFVGMLRIGSKAHGVSSGSFDMRCLPEEGMDGMCVGQSRDAQVGASSEFPEVEMDGNEAR